MTVDYATKKWQRANEGWAIRNIKLRMSRKLVFVKGMLMCFLCAPAFSGQSGSADPSIVELELLNLCKQYSDMPAIDLLSQVLLNYGSEQTIRKTFGAYEHFLATMDDPNKRDDLKKQPFDYGDEGLFREMRQVSREFRDGVNELFFDSNENLAKLTKGYGVF